VGFEVSWHSSDWVCFAEHAGDSLPRGEDFDGRLCRGRLAGHTASVWRRFWLRAVVRRVWREEQRTAAAMEAIGGLIVGIVLRVKDLQLSLVQVAHFVSI
jgi:hypothetical protein